MEHVNAKRLSAILVKWLDPMAGQIAGMKVESLPFLANVQEKLRNSGWVSRNYSITDDLSPIMGGIIGAMIEPIIFGMVQGIPDESIPLAVRKIVGAGIRNNGLSILEGQITFSREDMEHLSRMVERNLPMDDYVVDIED